MKRNNAGSTLVEIVVATAIMGILVGAVCTSLLFGLRLNEKIDAQLNAQLAVSSVVETLMAEGIDPVKSYDSEVVSVTIVEHFDDSNNLLPYFEVTVKSNQGQTVTVTTKSEGEEETTEEVFIPLASITTYIRKAVTQP